MVLLRDGGIYWQDKLFTFRFAEKHTSHSRMPYNGRLTENLYGIIKSWKGGQRDETQSFKTIFKCAIGVGYGYRIDSGIHADGIRCGKEQQFVNNSLKLVKNFGTLHGV